MMFDIHVLCDGNWNQPEVEISGSWKAFAKFSAFLKTIRHSTVVRLPKHDSEFYPVCINDMLISLDESTGPRLTVTIDESKFTIAGTNESLALLGENVEFDEKTPDGYHFHMDYYEGNQELNETNCSLIFSCIGEC